MLGNFKWLHICCWYVNPWKRCRKSNRWILSLVFSHYPLLFNVLSNENIWSWQRPFAPKLNNTHPLTIAVWMHLGVMFSNCSHSADFSSGDITICAKDNPLLNILSQAFSDTKDRKTCWNAVATFIICLQILRSRILLQGHWPFTYRD